MQRKDIKVGEHYAYAGSSYGTAYEVEVVSLDGKIKRGNYSWNRSTVSGIVVKRVSGPRAGQEFTVTGRNLRHTWAEEERIRKARDESAQAAQQAREETAARRAAKARQIEDVLAAHGVEVNRVSVGWGDAQDALKAVGYEFTTDSAYNFKQERTESRFDLWGFMQNGRLDEEVVTVLLADSKVVGA